MEYFEIRRPMIFAVIRGDLKRFSCHLISFLTFFLIIFSFSNSFSATIQYTYDNQHRLVGITSSDGFSTSYYYDNLGNRISHQVIGDSDGDGIDDHIENSTCTDTNNSDTDGDDLPDGVEDANRNGILDTGETNPCISDTDGDGMPDGWEAQYGLNPLAQNAGGDSDSDGLTNLHEYLHGTAPNDGDTDDDGMPDGWEVGFGLNPIISDAGDDADDDGFTNFEEYEAQTDPIDPESKPDRKKFGLPWLDLLLGE